MSVIIWVAVEDDINMLRTSDNPRFIARHPPGKKDSLPTSFRRGCNPSARVR